MKAQTTEKLFTPRGCFVYVFLGFCFILGHMTGYRLILPITRINHKSEKIFFYRTLPGNQLQTLKIRHGEFNGGFVSKIKSIYTNHLNNKNR